MSTCQVDARQRARAAAEAIATHPDVLGVDVLDPTTDPTACFTLECTLRPQAGGVPAPVLSDLSARGCTVRDVSRQGEHWRAVATV